MALCLPCKHSHRNSRHAKILSKFFWMKVGEGFVLRGLCFRKGVSWSTPCAPWFKQSEVFYNGSFLEMHPGSILIFTRLIMDRLRWRLRKKALTFIEQTNLSKGKTNRANGETNMTKKCHLWRHRRCFKSQLHLLRCIRSSIFCYLNTSVAVFLRCLSSKFWLLQSLFFSTLWKTSFLIVLPPILSCLWC